MRTRLLAFLLLVASANLVQADYVVIIANLNAGQADSPQPGTPGVPGAPGGGPPGGGFSGGIGGGGLGGGGIGGGGAIGGGIGGGGIGGGGIGGGAMGGGMPGGPPGGYGMMGGMGGPSGGRPGMPGMGGMGGMMGGMGGPSGGRPGMPGMGGMGGMMGGMGGMGSMGGMMGGMGGMMGGMMGSMGMMRGAEADDAPYLIVTVLEVQDLGNKVKAFKANQLPLTLRHRWGKVLVGHRTGLYEVIPLETPNGKLVPSVGKTFQQKFEELNKGKSGPEEHLELARWALGHGLTDGFEKVMDHLAQIDKNLPVVIAYSKVKADLARPLPPDDVSSTWKGKLLDGYKVTTADNKHFALVHQGLGENSSDGKKHLERLENTFRSFYYWWALQGVNLPIPSQRQVAILTDKPDDFQRLKKHLSASPVLTDSFSAGREGLSVFSSKRADDSYLTLEKVAKPEWDKGFIRQEILTGQPNRGVPSSLRADPNSANLPRTYAVLLQALEDEWEVTGLSHEATRQLLYSSGLLHPNVHVPEWIQFGMGSFFEMPLQSPWGGPGFPNPYWFPRFKENYKSTLYNKAPGGKDPSSYDALVSVVTDAGFRSKPRPGETPESHLRHGRASAWALTYFLARNELGSLRKYFQELSQMPRDLVLDDKVLLAAFARAFNCANTDGSPNKGKLTALADRWIRFIDTQSLELEAVHKRIRDYYQQVTTAARQKQQGNPGGAGGPGGAGPVKPGGNNRPGGGGGGPADD